MACLYVHLVIASLKKWMNQLISSLDITVIVLRLECTFLDHTWSYSMSFLQDLVNLFLVGKAVSNTHDGVITLGTGSDSVSVCKYLPISCMVFVYTDAAQRIGLPERNWIFESF